MIICEDCVRVFPGTRAEARRARWEPNSFDSQWAIEHGPMTCPECIMKLLNQILDLLRGN